MKGTFIFLAPLVLLGLTGTGLILLFLLLWQFPALMERIGSLRQILILLFLLSVLVQVSVFLYWRRKQKQVDEWIIFDAASLLLAPGSKPSKSESSDFFRRFPVNALPKRNETPVPHIAFELTRFQEQIMYFSLRVPKGNHIAQTAIGEVLVDWPRTEIKEIGHGLGQPWPPNLGDDADLIDVPLQVRGREGLIVCVAPLILTEGSLNAPHEEEAFHDKITSLLRALDQLPEGSIAGVQYLIRPASRTALYLLRYRAKGVRNRLQPTKEQLRPLEEDKLRRTLGELNRRLEDSASLYEVVPMIWAAAGDKREAKTAVIEIGRKLAGEYRGARNQARLGRIRIDKEQPWTRAYPLMGGFVMTAHELNSYVHLPAEHIYQEIPLLRTAGAHAPQPRMHLLSKKRRHDWRQYGLYTSPTGNRYFVGHGFKETQTNTFVVGSTGTGKSTLLKNIIMQDWAAGNGVLVIDPKSDLAEDVLSLVPQQRVHQVMYLDMRETHPFRFNMVLAGYEPDDIAASVAAVMEAIQLGMGDNWEGAVTMQEILQNGLRLLLIAEGAESSLVTLERIINDGAFRARLMKRIEDDSRAQTAIRFWREKFASRDPKEQVRSLQVVNRRLSAVLESDAMRHIFGFSPSSIDIASLLDQGYLILAPMPQTLSPELVRIWSGLLVRDYMRTALKRETLSPQQRERDARRLTLVVDELAQTIGHFPEMVKKLLSVGRAFKSGVVLATQFYSQLPEDVLNTIQENALTQIGFRMGETDKRRVASIMGEGIEEEDVVKLKRFHAYVRLAEAGGQSEAVLVKTLPPKTAVRGMGIALGNVPEPLPTAFEALVNNLWPQGMVDGPSRLAFITKVLALPKEEGVKRLYELLAGGKEIVDIDPTQANALRNELLLQWLGQLDEVAFGEIMIAKRTWDAWRRAYYLAAPHLETQKVKRIRRLSQLAIGVPWWESRVRFVQSNKGKGGGRKQTGENKYYL